MFNKQLFVASLATSMVLLLFPMAASAETENGASVPPASQTPVQTESADEIKLRAGPGDPDEADIFSMSEYVD